jgi:hypothetical protein
MANAKPVKNKRRAEITEGSVVLVACIREKNVVFTALKRGGAV